MALGAVLVAAASLPVLVIGAVLATPSAALALLPALSSRATAFALGPRLLYRCLAIPLLEDGIQDVRALRLGYLRLARCAGRSHGAVAGASLRLRGRSHPLDHPRRHRVPAPATNGASYW